MSRSTKQTTEMIMQRLIELQGKGKQFELSEENE